MTVGGQHHGQGSSPQERVLILSELEAGWGPEPVWMFWRREKSLLAPRSFEYSTRSQPCSWYHGVWEVH